MLKENILVKRTIAFLSSFGMILSSLYWGAFSLYAENEGGLGWVNRVKTEQGDQAPSDLSNWLPRVLNFAIGFSALVCVAVLIGSGYMYITAAGDEEKVRKAGKSMTYAVIGLVICVISAVLVEFILKRVILLQAS